MTGGDTDFESTTTTLAAKGFDGNGAAAAEGSICFGACNTHRGSFNTIPSSCAWRDEVEALWPHCSMSVSPSQDAIALRNSSSSVLRAILLRLKFQLYLKTFV